MNRRDLLTAGLLALTGSSTADAVEPDPAEIPRERLLTVAREIMKAARYCALITQNESGYAQSRTMDPFPPDEGMVVWLGTNPRTRKVRQIERNPRVTLYYYDTEAQGYVTILGLARVVNDSKEKKSRWKEVWKEFYPDREKDYALISVTPELVEVLSPKHGATGDTSTWVPPSVRFEPSRPRR